MVAEKYPAGSVPGSSTNSIDPSSHDMNNRILSRASQVNAHVKPLITAPAARKGLSARGIAEIQARKPEAIRKMSGTSTPATGSGMATPMVENGQRKLKILMLHGYTQSGPSFHAKTKALEKQLSKAFPPVPEKSSNPNRQHAPPPGSLSEYPGGIQLIYPTAPHRLRPSQIPGYIPKEGAVGKDDEIEAFAWWRREESTGKYFGMEEGLQTTAQAIREVGGIDAVVGFSQGGCGAAFVASLLEEERIKAFEAKQATGGISYPESFRKLREEDGQGPLKFAVSYAGFWAPREDYDAFYDPKISTPFLHVIGSLDTVVEDDRTQGLIDRTVYKDKVVHPGGHFVPVGKEWVAALINFIRGTLEGKEEKEEEGVEDMDMPF